MSSLTRDDLKTLMAREGGPCVSIYLPTHRAGKEIQQDPIRLKNLLREAEDRLAGDGNRRPEVDEMLDPARRLLGDPGFWRHQSDGLAIFLAPGHDWRYRLPVEFEELLVIAGHFHLKPLLPLLTGDGRFYVLALSQKQVRLLEGTRFRIRELDLRDVPQSLADALGHDWEERSLQFHTGTGQGDGARGTIFHGQGAGEDDAKAEIHRYFEILDDAVREYLNPPQAPLVVVAVDYLISMYREVSHYPKLVEEGVSGNPDELSAHELHDRAWRCVEPVFHREQEEAARQLRRLLGTGKATNQLEEIVPAAFDGRVDTLFVAVGVEKWGRFDPEERKVELDGGGHNARNSHEDLLNLAALQSLQHGGTVFAVPEGDVPGEPPAAALFRF